MVGIVDYGMGNLLSVFNAFEYLGAEVKICKRAEDLKEVERIVIPGVGAFNDCINKIMQAGFKESLDEQVLKLGKPILGICLGMQIMATKGFEGDECDGLNWVDANVIRLAPENNELRVPNIGWNDISFNPDIPLFKGLPKNADFYLVHSYFLKATNPTDVVATYEYGHEVTAAILKDNIFATQFHPEKSQEHGLQLLTNFINWRP